MVVPLSTCHMIFLKSNLHVRMSSLASRDKFEMWFHLKGIENEVKQISYPNVSLLIGQDIA